MRNLVTAALLLPVLLGVLAGCGPSQNEDERLQSIYNTEWKWRTDQRSDDEDATRPIADHLPKVDAATQEMRLKYWENVQKQLDGIDRARALRARSRSITTSIACRSRR